MINGIHREELFKLKQEKLMKSPHFKMWQGLCFIRAYASIPLEDISEMSGVPLDKINSMVSECEILDYDSLKKIELAIENYITGEYTIKIFNNMKQDWQKGN